MKATTIILALINVAISSAAPATDAGIKFARGDSGCTAYSNPDCGVSGTFCQCANGFYLFNADTNNCQPPWAYVTSDVSSLPGYQC